MIDDGAGGQGHDAEVDELVAAPVRFEPDQLDRMAADVEPRQQGLAAEVWGGVAEGPWMEASSRFDFFRKAVNDRLHDSGLRKMPIFRASGFQPGNIEATRALSP